MLILEIEQLTIAAMARFHGYSRRHTVFKSIVFWTRATSNLRNLEYSTGPAFFGYVSLMFPQFVGYVLLMCLQFLGYVSLMFPQFFGYVSLMFL